VDWEKDATQELDATGCWRESEPCGSCFRSGLGKKQASRVVAASWTGRSAEGAKKTDGNVRFWCICESMALVSRRARGKTSRNSRIIATTAFFGQMGTLGRGGTLEGQEQLVVAVPIPGDIDGLVR
jgi:hypothetical protein